MPRLAPDDLSATLAEMGLAPHIHQVVRRIKLGGGGEPAAAPRVVVISLSLAGETRPVARIMSPNAGA